MTALGKEKPESSAPSGGEALGAGPARRLARAYVPFQEYTRRYSPEEGLKKGTIFPELYQPYRLGGSREG
ncbi:MAG: spore coat associated protein CotJA [Clostridia bacterium]|jgi:hypothetical protein|nr:spore coat associated protein CotJA [Clostridia bacterium]MDH7573233.1 spore coat associated protein CotJA [Clostridia bacterium]